MRHHHRHRGQALVEFALIVTILTLLLASTLEIGRAVSARIQISGMARAAAQYGSIAELVGVSDAAAIRAGMVQAALDEVGRGTIYGVQPDIDAEPPALNAAGECVARATVTYPFQPLIAIPPIPNQIDITQSVEMRVLFIPPDMCIDEAATP